MTLTKITAWKQTGDHMHRWARVYHFLLRYRYSRFSKGHHVLQSALMLNLYTNKMLFRFELFIQSLSLPLCLCKPLPTLYPMPSSRTIPKGGFTVYLSLTPTNPYLWIAQILAAFHSRNSLFHLFMFLLSVQKCDRALKVQVTPFDYTVRLL